MNKKIIVGISVTLAFILAITFFIINKQNNFTKELTTKLDSLKKQYDFIDSYQTSDYYSSHLTIKVKKKFENLSNTDKYKKISEINYEASNIINMALIHNNVDFYPEAYIDNQLLTVNSNKGKYTFKDGILTLPDGIKLSENGVELETEAASDMDATQSDYTSATSISSNSRYPCEPSEENKVFAWAAAKQTVEENLKAPSTADFPFGYFNQKIKEVDYNVFEVNSYVDAENSFGAKIRSNFSVRIKKTGEESYVVENVSIN